MDPIACYKLWIEAARARRTSEARRIADDYNAWIDRGGFRATFPYGGLVAVVERLSRRRAHGYVKTAEGVIIAGRVGRWCNGPRLAPCPA